MTAMWSEVPNKVKVVGETPKRKAHMITWMIMYTDNLQYDHPLHDKLFLYVQEMNLQYLLQC